MNFDKMMQKLKDGKYVTRSKWRKDDYLFMELGVVKNDGGNVYKFTEQDRRTKTWKVKPEKSCVWILRETTFCVDCNQECELDYMQKVSDGFICDDCTNCKY